MREGRRGTNWGGKLVEQVLEEGVESVKPEVPVSHPRRRARVSRQAGVCNWDLLESSRSRQRRTNN